MRTLAEIEARLDSCPVPADSREAARELLADAEAVLEHWIAARGEAPTAVEREGFRLLALHRQGARGEPSFNACRETCREIAYHYNLIHAEPGPAAALQASSADAVTASITVTTHHDRARGSVLFMRPPYRKA